VASLKEKLGDIENFGVWAKKNRLILENENPFYKIVSLYINALELIKLRTSILAPISQAVVKVAAQISDHYQYMKENESRLGTSESDDPLREMLSGLNRSLIWFVGQTAYRLIKFKDESAEKKDKEGNPTEKMQDLIVQSNLLSGGIEQRFIGSFSAET